MTKTSGIILGVVGVIAVAVIALIMLVVGAYNSMVGNQEQATTALANVEATYQRRADLIPNLVETVKGYAAHERETFEALTKARAEATSIHLDANDLTPEKLQQFQQAQSQLSQSLGRLIAVAENYPELKASENFRALQDQLEGTENRINEARQKYNEAVQQYNVGIRRFPNVLFAGILGFDQMQKFEAQQGAETAPQVSF